MATTLGAVAASSLISGQDASAQSQNWDQGEVKHILPTANHDRLLFKISLNRIQEKNPSLFVGSNSYPGIRTDTEGKFWAFDVNDLEPDTEYEISLLDVDSKRLCDSWPIRTFPHPNASPDRLRLLIYTCAGGHDGLRDPDTGLGFVPIPERRSLLKRALSYQPDAVVSIGDHVYWDLRAGKSARTLGDSPAAKSLSGIFDRTNPVLGTPNEKVLKLAVGPQIADLYGTLFRSTPTFFYQDDHDYFENDHADDSIITFPPDAFMLGLGRASQWLYYPEFLPDENRPLGLAASSAADRPAGLSECYGTLRYGKLFEAMLYDCVRFLTLKGPSATFVEPDAENWLLSRMKESDARHVVNMPSSPVGWTAGKWAEWYPDVLTKDAALSRDVEKPYWQTGWRSQHNRLLSAASAMDKRALFISGDIHSLGETHMMGYDEVSFEKNPIVSILSGPLGSSARGFPSAFRGTRALPPLGMRVDEKLPALEENGFIIADFTADEIVLNYFGWLPKRGPDAIESLEPFRRTVIPV